MNDAQNSGNKFNMVLKAAMNTPGIQINRSDFLRKELSKHFDFSVVDLAIKTNPASAGIRVDQLESIANACINFECNKATLLSVAAGVPGGYAMLATVPTDFAQYFAHIIRVLQKLIYLYGWQDIYKEDGNFDDETLNQLTIFVGVMFGVNSATKIINIVAQCAATQTKKTLANRALTKGAIYPVVKKIAGILGVKMTKKIFANSTSKIIPILGAVISGTITYLAFKPLAENLQQHLKTLTLADADYYKRGNNVVIDAVFKAC